MTKEELYDRLLDDTLDVCEEKGFSNERAMIDTVNYLDKNMDRIYEIFTTHNGRVAIDITMDDVLKIDVKVLGDDE